MRYPIHIYPLFRPFFLVLGATPSRSYVELRDADLVIKFGWSEDVIPYALIASAELMRWPIFLYGGGIRIGPGWTLGFIGSSSGVVRLNLRERLPFKVPFTLRFDKLACSMEDPEAFLTALRERLGS